MDLIVNDLGKKSAWWCCLRSSRVKVFSFIVVQEFIEALCLLLLRWLGSPGSLLMMPFIILSRFVPLSLTRFALGPVVIRSLIGPEGNKLVTCLAFPFLGSGLGGHPADQIAFGMLSLQMVTLDLCVNGVSQMPKTSLRDRQSLAALPWRHWGMIARSVGSALCCALALNGPSCTRRFGGDISASLRQFMSMQKVCGRPLAAVGCLLHRACMCRCDIFRFLVMHFHSCPAYWVSPFRPFRGCLPLH